MILRMLWLACYNPEIDWRTGEVKMMRCREECGKQQRLKQGKLGWQKQKEKEAKEKAGRKWKEKEKMIEVRRVAEEWEVWDEEEEATRSEAEAKKLVLEKFYKWIKVFSKKQSERMLTRKV